MSIGRGTRAAALIATVLLLAACGSSAAPPSASMPATSAAPSTVASGAPASDLGLKGTWAEIVVAAAEEGTLNLWVHAGPGFEDFAAAAQEALPDLDIQVTSAGAGSQAPLVAQEQQGGVYTWDIVMAGNSGVATTLNPIGATIPIRPFFDAVDQAHLGDDDWVGGFHVYANDDELNWVIQHQLTGGLWINRTLAPDVSDADDLLDSQWVGRIAIDDPSTVSTGSGSLANMLGLKGKDYIRALLDQDPIITDGPQETILAVADGRAAIGIGGNASEYAALQADGLVDHVEQLLEHDLFMWVNIYGMSVFKNLPHPNATAVFIDWALSPEGMEAWSTLSRADATSRRIGTNGGGTLLTADQVAAFPFTGGTYAGQELQSQIFEMATQ